MKEKFENASETEIKCELNITVLHNIMFSACGTSKKKSLMAAYSHIVTHLNSSLNDVS